MDDHARQHDQPAAVNDPDRAQEMIDAAREQARDAARRAAAITEVSPDPARLGGTALPRDSFAGYEILREIHRGGQGVVYQALQKSTQRKVAIKVMREGPFAGAADKARFDREVQILAQFKHPNIVTVHDTGTAAGCDFFVMDYISGLALDDWVAESGCVPAAAESRADGPEQRGGRAPRSRSVQQGPRIDATLRVFVKICDAVNAAHLRGIIHRDLKPGNIRVDSRGEPHVLDFGLAKVSISDSDAAAMTMTGQFVGSLPWASPEQAEGRPDKIDIRTDVYSLGVVLFQMLTGRFPYDVTGGVRDALDRIIRVEPQRPRLLQPAIGDEVETIVLKCLSKERERRYQSAGELSRDIRHYLAGEPIEAKRDSALYLLRKQIWRYRAAVVVAGLFVILLAASVVVTSVQAARNARLAQQEAAARALAQAATTSEVEQRRLAENARREAEQQRDAAESQAYVANIAAAAAALDANDVAAMRARLIAAPERLRNWEWRYLSARSDRSLDTRSVFPPGVFQLALDSHGLRVAAAMKNSIVIWSVTSGRDVTIPLDETTTAFTLAISADGTRIAAGLSDRSASVWDLESGGEIATLRGHRDTLRIVAFSPNGRWLATGSRDDTAKIWDISNRAEVATLRGHTADVRSVTFSPDSTKVATGSDDGTVRLWNAANGAALLTVSGQENVAFARGVAFSPDGTRLLSASQGNTAKVWDVASGAEIAALRGHKDAVHLLCFSPDGTRIATASHDRTLKIWDARDGTELATLRGHETWIADLEFSPDGTRLITAGGDGTVKTWDVASAPDVIELPGHMPRIFAAAFSPDGTRVVTQSGDGRVRIFNAADGMEIATLRAPTRDISVTCVAFSEDGTRIVTAEVDQTVMNGPNQAATVWDADTGAERARLTGHSRGLTSACFSPDGRSVITGSYDRLAKIWDVEGQSEPRTLRGHTDSVLSVAWTRDGRIATGSADGTAKVWDAASGAELATLRGHAMPVRSLAVNHDGSRLATGSVDHTAKVWSTVDWSEVVTLRGHSFYVNAVAFSPDNTRLVTGSSDYSAKIWDAADGREIAALRTEPDEVYTVAFSPDGTRVLTAGDRTVKIWDSVPEAQRSRQRAVRNAAQPQAERTLAAALRATDDYSEAAARLRANQSLAADVQRAALDLLLQRAGAARAAARSYISPLMDRLIFRDAIEAAIRADASLAPDVRRVAIELAATIRETSTYLNDFAWRLVRYPGGAAESYEVGLRAATEACRLLADNGYFLDTLGVAQYRTGRFEEALATLRRADELNSQPDTPPNLSRQLPAATQPAESAPPNLGIPADVAFIAMSLQKLGRCQEASVALGRLHVMMQDAHWVNNEESQAFLREVEALVGAPAD